MERLPKDLIIYLFNFIETTDLGRVARISRFWYNFLSTDYWFSRALSKAKQITDPKLKEFFLLWSNPLSEKKYYLLYFRVLIYLRQLEKLSYLILGYKIAIWFAFEFDRPELVRYYLKRAHQQGKLREVLMTINFMELTKYSVEQKRVRCYFNYLRVSFNREIGSSILKPRVFTIPFLAQLSISEREVLYTNFERFYIKEWTFYRPYFERFVSSYQRNEINWQDIEKEPPDIQIGLSDALEDNLSEIEQLPWSNFKFSSALCYLRKRGQVNIEGDENNKYRYFFYESYYLKPVGLNPDIKSTIPFLVEEEEKMLNPDYLELVQDLFEDYWAQSLIGHVCIKHQHYCFDSDHRCSNCIK